MNSRLRQADALREECRMVAARDGAKADPAAFIGGREEFRQVFAFSLFVLPVRHGNYQRGSSTNYGLYMLAGFGINKTNNKVYLPGMIWRAKSPWI